MFTKIPLYYASLLGINVIIKDLIEPKDQCQKTPLYSSSSDGKTDIVKFLVSKEANKNSKDKEDKSEDIKQQTHLIACL